MPDGVAVFRGIHERLGFLHPFVHQVAESQQRLQTIAFI
jgi:hypothetical protein